MSGESTQDGGAVGHEQPGPFIDVSGEDPTAVNKHNVPGKCYYSTRDGGECEAMGLSFETAEEWQEHCDEYHPVGCGSPGCDVLGAYKRDNAPHPYCYKHIPDDPDTVFRWRRANTKSVFKPPKAEGHIIEESLPEVDRDG